MNIKSLLIGSAAALVAVSGARAADAVVAEPEAVEYVRVCDAYGAGYFYIPGTETCLKIGGYVRYDIKGGELFAVTSDTGDDTYAKNARLSLQLSTASETELGTLRTYAEVRYNFGVTDDTLAGYDVGNSYSLNFAYIELGGLRIGKDESMFTTFTGYAGSVINDGLAGGYGPFDTNLISYSYSNNGFSFGVSLEEGVGNPGWGIDDYMPHVVAGLGYDAGAFQIRGVVGYDTQNDIGLVERGGWTGKLRGDVKMGEQFSAFMMVMYGENTSNYTTWARGGDDHTLSIIGGASFQASEKLALNAELQWVDGNAFNDDWSLSVNAAYTVVPGLTVTPEISYYDDGVDGAVGGTLRFQRSF